MISGHIHLQLKHIITCYQKIPFSHLLNLVMSVLRGFLLFALLVSSSMAIRCHVDGDCSSGSLITITAAANYSECLNDCRSFPGLLHIKNWYTETQRWARVGRSAGGGSFENGGEINLSIFNFFSFYKVYKFVSHLEIFMGVSPTINLLKFIWWGLVQSSQLTPCPHLCN